MNEGVSEAWLHENTGLNISDWCSLRHHTSRQIYLAHISSLVKKLPFKYI